MSNCFSLSFPPLPVGLRESLKGKLLAVDPGVSDEGMVFESIVCVEGMSRGAGDGFMDGLGVGGAETDGCREGGMFGESEMLELSKVGEPDGPVALPLARPASSSCKSGGTAFAPLRTASYSCKALWARLG